MNDVIFLITESMTQDANHVLTTAESKRQVFCTVSSVGMREITNASQMGIQPEYQFSVFQGDYQGERIVEYHGERYTVYRTYRAGDKVELYCQTRRGSDA